MQHVMLDLETLATTADAAIMSIGAVKFDLESDALDDAGFYASISVVSNTDKGRRIDEETLIWWVQQEKAAQAVFTEPKQALSAALEDLSDWFDREDLFVWSCGADFDLPMLAHAYRQHDWLPPWKFWNARCYRTMKSLFPGAKAQKGVKHNALDDAITQAKHLQAIYAQLRNKGKVPA